MRLDVNRTELALLFRYGTIDAVVNLHAAVGRRSPADPAVIRELVLEATKRFAQEDSDVIALWFDETTWGIMANLCRYIRGTTRRFDDITAAEHLRRRLAELPIEPTT